MSLIMPVAFVLLIAEPTVRRVEADALKALKDMRPKVERDAQGRVWLLDLSERDSAQDAALKHVRSLQNLRELYLIYTPLTGTGLVHLRELKQLTKLDLYGCALVTDPGIRHIRHLGSLEYLDLTGTGVTDEGVLSLSGLKRLRILRLGETAVSDEGVARLQRALPEVEIERE